MTMVCEGLELLAIPHVGIYDTQGYQIFTSSPVRDSITQVPSKLISQLSRLGELGIPVDSLTLCHSAGFLSSYSDSVNLNLIFQPYVFYDARFGHSHECTLNFAVYQDDCEYSSMHLNNKTSDSVAINPDDIFNCQLFTCVHPDKGYMCLSPNNGRVKVSTYVPMHIFFTLVLVPYKGKIVKGLVTKHLLIIDKEKIGELDWVSKAKVDEDDMTMNFDMLDRLGSHPGNVWYMHYILWKLYGRPKKNNFGEEKWRELQERFLDDQNEKEILLTGFEVLFNDLKTWLEMCHKGLEEIKDL